MRKFNVSSHAFPKNNITLILKIIALILKLILSGKSENEAFKAASAKFNIPVSQVHSIWNKHKAFH